MKQYDISTIDPAPAMTHTKFVFTGTFGEAIEAAHAWFAQVRRTTCIFDKGGSTCWYRIAEDGTVTNLNDREICEH